MNLTLIEQNILPKMNSLICSTRDSEIDKSCCTTQPKDCKVVGIFSPLLRERKSL